MDLYYEIKGNGHPVILVHSGGTDLRDWTYVAPLLAKTYKVIAFDGRGAGKSPAPTNDVNYVEDLRRLLDHLKISKATIVGHSMGGQIATDFALEYPESVSELILIAPALSGFNYSPEFLSYINKVTEAAPDIEKMIEIAESAPSYQVVKSRPQLQLFQKMFRHHVNRTFQWPEFELIWPEPPAAERLGDLTAKTLFMIGTEELDDNVRVADYFRRHSNARIIEIPGADHMPTLTHPKELTHFITAFMEDDISDATHTRRE